MHWNGQRDLVSGHVATRWAWTTSCTRLVAGAAAVIATRLYYDADQFLSYRYTDQFCRAGLSR
jgi:hypothetical protein